MPIRLMENFRAVFYAPYYALHALGFYEREGIEVELKTSSTPGDAVPKLVDGSIDLTWGGPMRVMKAHDQDPRSSLVSFCEIVSHDPFFLIGKHRPDFKLTDLAKLRFASVSEVPTPWMCLQHDLRLAGLDPARLARIADQTMERNHAALRAGSIDVMQAFEPFPSLAAMDGSGEILDAASTRGPTVYTAFIATRESIARNRTAFEAMTRAAGKMLQWLYAHPAEELAEAVAPYFADVPRDTLASSLTRYRAAGLWARTPVMSREGFTRLAQSLHSGGFIARMPGYDECVDQSLGT